ncbi:MAG: dimethyl sulfoxide reductase anchor subunit [Flavimaricola sp.]|nr:dimethyl sulfoxide reductase anchor subunit [Flavimaricola sp.]
MHPAPSVILFTTLSGLGFGLLFWLGLGMPGPTGVVAFVFFAIAYLLAVGGLLASTFHLGHPERALKAFSQWQTSWLSREAWASVAALVVMAVYGAGLVFLGTKWTALGLIGAVLSIGTVFTTSMIYAQLRTVPRWHHWTTPAVFLCLSLGGGALLAGQIRFALPLLALAGVAQAYTWITGDARLRSSGTTLASATGLQGGSIRAFEPPHTGTNYLLREFVYVVGRKHSRNLRVISLTLGFILPIVLLLLPFNHILAGVAVVSHLAGVLVARWLFFAEAEHVVGLYYGKRTT